MKNKFRMLLMVAVLGLICGTAVNSYAQTNVPVPVVGGYGSADVADKEVIAAANYAVKAEAKKQKSNIRLISIKSAQQQVVTGMNYNLCLNTEVIGKGKKTGIPQTSQALVYKSLKQKYSLTSWKNGDCAMQ